MRTKPSWRQLNLEEKEIIDALLTENFPGRDEIREQLKTASVRSVNCLCKCNSIEFSIKSNLLVSSKERVPVDASYYKGKNPYQILLHIVDGKVNELEFVSYSDEVGSGYPKANELKVAINEKLS